MSNSKHLPCGSFGSSKQPLIKKKQKKKTKTQTKNRFGVYSETKYKGLSPLGLYSVHPGFDMAERKQLCPLDPSLQSSLLSCHPEAEFWLPLMEELRGKKISCA